MDALIDLVKLPLANANTILRAICYEDTADSSVYSYDLAAYAGTVSGTYNAGSNSGEVESGDTANVLRWGTGRFTSKAKPIYLRKFFHPGIGSPSDRDAITTHYKGVTDTFASAVISSSGDWPGLAGPDGVAPTGYRTMPFVTTRQLKRGRKRPT